MKGMQRLFRMTAMLAVGTGLAVSSRATVLIDEQFESGYNRTLANAIGAPDSSGGNMAWFKGRSNTSATINVGSISFVTSASAGASGYWSYFVDSGANYSGIGGASSIVNGHLNLGVGDVLVTTVGFAMGTMPVNTQLRFGLFDSAGASQVPDGTRFAGDKTGGPADAAFVNDTGYALFVPLASTTGLNNQLDIRRRTTFTSSNIFSAQADFTPIGSAVGGAYTPLLSGTNYTLTLSVARLDASTWQLYASIKDTLTQNIMTEGSVTATGADGLTSFNWIHWRMGVEAPGNPDIFTQLKVEVVPIPEPSTLTLLGAGLGVMVALLRRRRR